jgi:hypothetical protein
MNTPGHMHEGATPGHPKPPQVPPEEAGIPAPAEVAKAMEGLEMPPVVEQYYEFCAWLLPKVSKFEKDQRYILGARLQNTALDALELIINAAVSPRSEKAAHLGAALLKLEHVRFAFRLAVQIRMLNPRSYAHGSRSVLAVARKLGGWKKSLAA